MSRSEVWAVLIIVAVGVLVGFSFGFSTAVVFRNRPLQDAAIERGYAEWVVPEGGRGEAVWQWVDTEGDDDGGKGHEKASAPEDGTDIPF